MRCCQREIESNTQHAGDIQLEFFIGKDISEKFLTTRSQAS